MKTLYLDDEYRIHLQSFEGATVLVTSAFDNVTNFDAVAKYYRYIPPGAGDWTSDTGDVYHEEEFVPIDRHALETINSVQGQYSVLEREYTSSVSNLVEMIYQNDLEVIG